MATQVRGLRLALAGFLIAAIGAGVGFTGFLVDEKWLSILGFSITVVGVAVGAVGIVYGWAKEGKRAISGSVQAVRELRNKIIGK